MLTLSSNTKETDLVDIIFKRLFFEPSITILPELIIISQKLFYFQKILNNNKMVLTKIL